MRWLWILLAVFLGGAALAADFTGTWKLNDKKSDPNPNLIAETMTIKQIGPNAYRTTVDRVLKSGEKRHNEMDRVYDGKERHVANDGLPEQGTEICEITPEGVRKITMRNDGKVAMVIESVISPDGKTMTHTMTGPNRRLVQVFEKQ